MNLQYLKVKQMFYFPGLVTSVMKSSSTITCKEMFPASSTKATQRLGQAGENGSRRKMENLFLISQGKK